MHLTKISLLGLITFSFINLYSQKKDSTINDYYIDFAVPDLGAFTLLNTKPENITTPGNTKEFAASLLNIVGAGASISPGIAIDWAPARTFNKKGRSPEMYRKSILLQNLQATYGTVKDSTGTNVGIGFKWTFIDKTDPLMDEDYAKKLLDNHKDIFIKNELLKNQSTVMGSKALKDIEMARKIDKDAIYYDELLLKYLDANDTTIQKKDLTLNYLDVINRLNFLIKQKSHYVSSTNDTISLTDFEKNRIMTVCKTIKEFDAFIGEYKTETAKQFDKLKKEWLNAHWNSSVWLLGGGWTGNSGSSKWKNLGNKYYKIYINGKAKCGSKSQFVFIGSYTMPENKTSTDSTIRSRLFGGLRFLTGNASNRFSIDLGYGYYSANKSKYNLNELIATVGFEFKLDDGIFLEIATGFSGPSTQAASDSFSKGNILALGSLKYAFNDKKRFKNGED